MRVLIYRLGSLGDTCVALPALRIVREWCPRAHITLLTNLPVSVKAAPSIALLDGMGLVGDYLGYPVGMRNPLKLMSLVWKLRRRRFETVVNLAAWRGDGALRRDAWFFRACGICHSVGFGAQEGGPLRISGSGEAEREAERLLRRVAALGTADLADRRWYDLSLTPAELKKAQQILSEGGVAVDFIAISLGAKLPVNEWGQENWRRLVCELGARHPELGVVFVGSSDETERSRDYLKAWPGPKLNLCGKCTPRESAAVLAQARIFVGHDSGPMHLAAAVGTPCVAIFAARNPPGQWFPLGEGHEVLYHRVECMSCGLDDCVVEQKRCIRDITVAEVAAAVTKKLDHSLG